MPLRPGETFGRYRLAERLGKGGMGEVYRAHDTVLHRHVALKVLTGAPGGEGAASSQGAARILREARSAAGITHPNAVAIYDVGEVDGVPFLAMELVAGRTLRTFVGDASIPLGRRVRWLIDVALALGAAHQLGIIHRDIKPENVMVGADGFVKVLDFGIARRSLATEDAPSARSRTTDLAALDPRALASTLTAGGVIVGTPMYMAPEQLRGEALDGRADQFAWGVLAYELLAGKRPWSSAWPELATEILSREATPLASMFPDFPQRVDAVVRLALAKSPKDRFGTMEEIAAELEPFAAAAGGGTTAAREALVDAPTQRRSVPVKEASARTAVTPATEREVAPGARGRLGSVLGLVAAVIVVGAAIGASRVRSQRTTRTAPDAAPVVEAPSQMSANPEATAAYLAGVEALRGASIRTAVRSLTRAVELDPLFAAARLQLALAKAVDFQTITSADLQPARDSRASLSERDRTLLDAIEPCGLSPPDLVESRHRLEAAVAKYPSDADFPLQLALVLDQSSQPSQALAELDAAIALDPGVAVAWMSRGAIAIETDDVAGAFEAYARCLKVSPAATSCLSDVATIETNGGKCEELVVTSRQLVALAPGAAMAYERLAEGIAGSGQPVDAIRATLRQKWDHEDPSQRHLSELVSEAALGILGGDFTGAEREYEELERLTASDPDDFTRFELAYPRMLIALEVGRPSQASRLAALYLRQRPAWSRPTYDNSLPAQAVELAAGAITRATFEELRDAWLTRNPTAAASNRWIDAYAVPAATREDAASALAMKPDLHPLVSALFMTPNLAEPIGRAYFLAGQLDEAIRLLSQASTACAVLDGLGALFSTWAAFDLGGALEARGDVAGACGAYGRVLTRWGAATPPSRTAAKALARRRALVCSPAVR